VTTLREALEAVGRGDPFALRKAVEAIGLALEHLSEDEAAGSAKSNVKVGRAR
jgi:hypothetical protein